MKLFAYKEKNTFFHKLPFFVKFLSFLFLSILAYKLPFYINFFLLLFLLLLSKLSLEKIYANLKFLAFYTILFFFFKSLGNEFSLQNLLFVLIFMQKITFVLFLSSIFYETSSKFDIFTFFEQSQNFLFRKKEFNFALILSLILACFSQIFELYERLNLAYKARNNEKNYFKNLYFKFTFLLPALIEELIEFANNVYKSLENRS